VDCLCLVFVGNIYQEYDFSTILKAVAECKKNISYISLIILGEGPLLDQVKKTVSEMKIKNNVIFAGYTLEKNLGKILPAADAGLLIRTKKGALRYGPVSTKLSTYLSYNLPVVTAGWSLEGYPDELAQGLYLIPPEDAQALSNMFTYLHNHPEDRARKVKILYDFASKKLTWESVANEILKVINDNRN
jgi:glycosyltransferase involved in cell wall biosynthesis